MTYDERLDDMLRRYGEVCRRSAAAKILHCCASKINAMLADGRLSWACGGTMVDVRSIAEYICKPTQAEEDARRRRIADRRGSKWSV
jgi:hypothetical protein